MEEIWKKCMCRRLCRIPSELSYVSCMANGFTSYTLSDLCTAGKSKICQATNTDDVLFTSLSTMSNAKQGLITDCTL